MKNIFFVVKGHGNYLENFGWDDGISMNVDNITSHTLAEVEVFEDLDKLPQNINTYVEWYANNYGGSRDAAIVIAAESIERAIELAKEYEATYTVVEFEEELNPEFIIAQDPNGVFSWFHSPISLIGSRWSYVCTCSSEKEANEYVDSKNNG